MNLRCLATGPARTQTLSPAGMPTPCPFDDSRHSVAQALISRNRTTIPKPNGSSSFRAAANARGQINKMMNLVTDATVID
jgi:hypothetical protein